MQVFKECSTCDDLGNSFELSLMIFKCVGPHVWQTNATQLKFVCLSFIQPIEMLMLFSNYILQIYWLWKKVNSQDDKGFQQFLDNVQYKSRGILRYERVFGEGFVSTGGLGRVFSNFRKMTYFPLFHGSYLNLKIHLNHQMSWGIYHSMQMRSDAFLMLIFKNFWKFYLCLLASVP